jgi:hypothetical protein
MFISSKPRISLWWMTDCIGVRGRALLREHAVTDQTPPHVLTEDDENLADHFVVSRPFHRACLRSSGHRLVGNPERLK